MHRRRAFGLLLALAVASPLAPASAAVAASERHAFVRVDQLGYLASERKIAYLLTSRAVPAATFRLVGRSGETVFAGTAGPSRGSWSDRFAAVQPLNFSALQAHGTYRIEVDAPASATSPWFQVGSSAALFGPRIVDTVQFFRAQRDGADVIPGPLRRQPAHLNDGSARLYDWPAYVSPDSDVIAGDALARIPGQVDLEGGWFDAGDFIKFTHTTAYATALMYASLRALGPAAPAGLATEARFGLAWLHKAWDARLGVLYLQVGIGSGNQAGTFNGDHDLWRLPQVDDHLRGPQNRYLRQRPAFRANEPGTALPPNLAGRVAAAFALAAQVDAATNPPQARKELRVAAEIYARAKKSHVRASDVVTALPHAFYPESSWRDDLELATAELTRAGQLLGDPRTAAWLKASARWAQAYLRREAGADTLNLYDTSALAHADLIRAMRLAGRPAGLAVGERQLVAGLVAQLRQGRRRAAADPFRAGAIYSGFDAAPHTFGLVATAQLYRQLTGERRFDAFAASQRNWALGANAWGVSLMIGVGTTFPHCMQHAVANLSGSTDGTPPLVRGAVVNGPNDATLFSGGLGDFFAAGKACPSDLKDRYARFSGHGSRFVDDVRAWQTVEPAIDFTAAALLAFALSR